MIPMKVLSPEMRKLFILLIVQRKIEKKKIENQEFSTILSPLNLLKKT